MVVTYTQLLETRRHEQLWKLADGTSCESEKAGSVLSLVEGFSIKVFNPLYSEHLRTISVSKLFWCDTGSGNWFLTCIGAAIGHVSGIVLTFRVVQVSNVRKSETVSNRVKKSDNIKKKSKNQRPCQTVSKRVRVHIDPMIGVSNRVKPCHPNCSPILSHFGSVGWLVSTARTNGRSFLAFNIADVADRSLIRKIAI